MATLALDLGTRTGFAVRAVGGSVHSGAWELPPDNRWLEFWSRLTQTHIAQRYDTLVIEKPIVYPGRPVGIRIAFGLAALVQMWADSTKAAFYEYAPATVKKAATGKGNATKDMMRAAAQRHFPDQQVQGYDHADALCVLYTYEQRRLR